MPESGRVGCRGGEGDKEENRDACVPRLRCPIESKSSHGARPPLFASGRPNGDEVYEGGRQRSFPPIEAAEPRADIRAYRRRLAPPHRCCRQRLACTMQ
jgi:hypothetical protein